MNRTLRTIAVCTGLLAVSVLVVGCFEDDVPASTINGIAVPPAPDPAVNNATIAGVDSNNNGVRDDVERFIAQEFGADPAKYTDAFEYARLEQAAIVTLAPADIAASNEALNCTPVDSLSQMESITLQILDTPARRAAYAKAFAGALLEDCPR